MCCQYEEGILVTGKCYPDNKTDRITRYRQMLQLILSTVEDVPNLWTFSRKVDRIHAFVETVDGTAHYRDYEATKQKPTISMCKHRIDLDHMMSIGHIAYCVHCGSSLEGTNEAWLQCERHRKKPICASCGCHVDEGNRIEIDDKYYCRDCVFWCDHHSRYELLDKGQNKLKLVDDITITVCDLALNYYSCCTGCGKWSRKTDSHYGNGGCYCHSCTQTLKAKGEWHSVFECVICDDYQVGDYVVMVDDVYVCTYGACYEMSVEFSNRVCRITNKSWECFSVTNGRGTGGWNWSQNCFRYKLVGDVNDSMLGKTLEEIGI